MCKSIIIAHSHLMVLRSRFSNSVGCPIVHVDDDLPKKLFEFGDIYGFKMFYFKNCGHRNPMWDFILICVIEISIKSYACTTQNFRPSQFFSKGKQFL